MESALRASVTALHANDMATWCRSVYYAGDDDQFEDGFNEPDGTFASMSPEERRQCVEQEAIGRGESTPELRVTDVALPGERRAVVTFDFRQGGEWQRGERAYLRRLDGRWLVQFSVR